MSEELNDVKFHYLHNAKKLFIECSLCGNNYRGLVYKFPERCNTYDVNICVPCAVELGRWGKVQLEAEAK